LGKRGGVRNFGKRMRKRRRKKEK
jgi:hypothetical protein